MLDRQPYTEVLADLVYAQGPADVPSPAMSLQSVSDGPDFAAAPIDVAVATVGSGTAGPQESALNLGFRV